MLRHVHVRRFHSESAKQKVAANAELDRLELLTSPSSKVPRFTIEEEEGQTGGATSTRGTKRTADEDITPRKKSIVDYSDTSDEEEEEDSNPLFVANVRKLGPAKRWKKNVVVNQKFNLTLDQQRPLDENEDINIGATHAIATAADQLIEELNIPGDYQMTLQIGSKEHQREGLTGETWRVPVSNFTERALMTQTLLTQLSRVLNSGEFITNDVGFSASVLFTRPETKGGKGKTSPGSMIWAKMVKKSKNVCEIKNKDELCCARALVVMREYTKRKAKEENTFENIRQDRGKNSQQLKEAKKLHQAARVPEGCCGLQEVDQFQEYLGPRGYRIIVLEAARGGVIYKGGAFQHLEDKIIAIVKSIHVDEQGQETAHYDGVYSIKGFMGRSYFCPKCCKGYDHEDSAHHRCLAKTCPACKQTTITKKKQEGCPDFTLSNKPDRSCRVCKREFYGEQCFRAHLVESVEEVWKKEREKMQRQLGEQLTPLMELHSICLDFHRCSHCLATYKVNKDLPHKCYHASCRHCLEYVNVYQHQCYITSEEEKTFKRTLQKPKKEKKKREQLICVSNGMELSDQDMERLIAQRKRKLKELERINRGVPQSEIRREEIQEQIIADLLEEGLSPEKITPEIVNERVLQEEEEEDQSSIDADHLVLPTLSVCWTAPTLLFPFSSAIPWVEMNTFSIIGEPIVSVSS